MRIGKIKNKRAGKTLSGGTVPLPPGVGLGVETGPVPKRGSAVGTPLAGNAATPGARRRGSWEKCPLAPTPGSVTPVRNCWPLI